METQLGTLVATLVATLVWTLVETPVGTLEETALVLGPHPSRCEQQLGVNACGAAARCGEGKKGLGCMVGRRRKGFMHVLCRGSSARV